MKQHIPFVVIVIMILISCQSNSGSNSKSNSKSNTKSDSNEQRFSKELDTTYKDNSTDIDKIKRTFYQLGDYSSDIMIRLEIEDKSNEIYIYCGNGEDIQITFFENTSQFQKFLKDARTVLNNPNKNLRYDFGYLEDNQINSGFSKGSVGLFLPENSRAKSVLIEVNSSEIDSMESCLNRFLKEK